MIAISNVPHHLRNPATWRRLIYWNLGYASRKPRFHQQYMEAACIDAEEEAILEGRDYSVIHEHQK